MLRVRWIGYLSLLRFTENMQLPICTMQEPKHGPIRFPLPLFNTCKSTFHTRVITSYGIGLIKGYGTVLIHTGPNHYRFICAKLWDQHFAIGPQIFIAFIVAGNP